MKRAKQHFGDQCIVTGLGSPDGCHLLPRSTHPHLAHCMYNIVPLARHMHQKMDEHRAADRIEWLRSVVLLENREVLDQWLIQLLIQIVRAA
jgi:hypothetical protein